MQTNISTELLANEEILWSGQPSKNLFVKSDILLIPLNLIQGSLVLLIGCYLIFSDSHIIFKLFGLPFALVGFYVIIGRFIYKSYIDRNTFYYVTTQKVIMTFRKKLTALYIKNIQIVEKKVNSKGNGNIRFGERPFYGKFYENTGMHPFGRGPIRREFPPTFYSIKDADVVYTMINEIKNQQNNNL